MSDDKRCMTCRAPVWWNPAVVEYRHRDPNLDRKHRPIVATNSYLDSPGMREAHLRSARGY